MALTDWDFYICPNKGRVVKGPKGDRPFLNLPPVAIRGDDKFSCSACGQAHVKRWTKQTTIEEYIKYNPTQQG